LVAKLISTRITLEATSWVESLSKKRPVNPPATLIFVVDSLKNVNDVLALRRIFRDEFLSRSSQRIVRPLATGSRSTSHGRILIGRIRATRRGSIGMKKVCVVVRSGGQETGNLHRTLTTMWSTTITPGPTESARRIVDCVLVDLDHKRSPRPTSGG